MKATMVCERGVPPSLPGLSMPGVFPAGGCFSYGNGQAVASGKALFGSNNPEC